MELDIIGPIKDTDYWADCQRLMASIPSPERVMFRGEIDPSEIELVMSRYHAMVLPTLGENFGHAIVEVLGCSRPVVISDKTPWNDISRYEAGFVLELNQQKWKEAIKKMISWNQEEFDFATSSAIKFYKLQFDFDKLKSKYIELFWGRPS